MANGLSDKQIEEFKEAFKIFEKDETGVISVEAVPILLRVIGQSLSNEEIAVLAEQASDCSMAKGLRIPNYHIMIANKISFFIIVIGNFQAWKIILRNVGFPF